MEGGGSTPQGSKRSSAASSRSSGRGERSRSSESGVGNKKRVEACKTIEKADTQFDIEKARLEKKREMHSKQFGKYSAAFYGTPLQKEELRKEQREGLLTQIRRKEETAKESLKDKVKESETAVAFDKRCLENDRQEHMKKANYLTQFRDGNKQLIEMRAEQRRRQREEENRHERELLKQNPVNWSNTIR